MTVPADRESRNRVVEPARAFTPGRVVALALIGLVVLGLAYLRFGRDSDAVSVPNGAVAGDLILERCDYETENGSYGADCGTLVVPENRADPDSRLIGLPVTRIRATSDDPAEPIFRLEGGPGITNMEFKRASRFADDHDVVLVGYRGVDGSVRLDCPEVESALKQSTDLLGEKSFRAYADGFRACADRLTEDGVDLAGYSLPQRVDDLEAARLALGYERVDLLGESVGTRTAMIYSWRYPESLHRSVMIGVNPPGHFLWDAQTTDEQIARYADLCAKDDTCNDRTDDLAASMRRTGADIPERWFFLPIKDGHVRVASFYGLMESTMENAPLSAPMTLSSWTSADDGDASGFWLQSLLADFFFPGSFVWGEYASVARADTQAARDYFSSNPRELDSLGVAATAFGYGGGRLTDAWPAAAGDGEYSRVRRSNVETLLIGGALDFATPPQVATKKLLPYLPNGHQVVLEGFGHSLDFWTYQPEAGDRLVNTFFDSGRVDDSLYEPQRVDFTPEVTQTALGKGIAGTMAGPALLTVLSLLWMPVRVLGRGGFGHKAGATLRWVYPIVLGVGGWFLGVLIVITTMPGIPLDNELLAALSVGVPVGLSVYWGWVRRPSPATGKAIGFSAAIAGAFAGAWLGFHAAADLLALVTAIVGAVAGANLTLNLLDISRARSVRDRFATQARVDARRPNFEPAAPTGVRRP
jgi:pimeloyl-ACP methyl ester carboxylesterase